MNIVIDTTVTPERMGYVPRWVEFHREFSYVAQEVPDNFDLAWKEISGRGQISTHARSLAITAATFMLEQDMEQFWDQLVDTGAIDPSLLNRVEAGTMAVRMLKQAHANRHMIGEHAI